MPLLEILLIAVGLAMDAFAVSLGIGTTRWSHGPRPLFRLSFHFGLFQCLMPIAGWAAGSSVAPLLASVDHWIALALLCFVGGRMIRSAIRPGETRYEIDPSRGWTLIMLSVATSIDAFAVGLTLAMLEVGILYPSVVIGVVTASLSLLGLVVGHRLGLRFGRVMEALGGLVLIAIGVRIVVTHLVQ